MRIAIFASTGCRRLWIGSESGSQRILDAMSRRVRVQQVQAMTHLARALGAARSGNPEAAKADIAKLAELRDKLRDAKDSYWSQIEDIQRQVADAWVLYAEGKYDQALNAMSAAARLEHSLHQYELEQLDARPFFAGLAEMYSDLYAPCRLSLSTEPGQLPQVKAAPELLAQMCDKLMENAADFSGPGGEIEMVLGRSDKWLRLQVINTGPPLPEALHYIP